ncbi:MAG: hypothetical protein IJ693_03335 [Bacteroidaceae bacterium]|nr:hypothetical protein [Bacteroidaceae bacterium]
MVKRRKKGRKGGTITEEILQRWKEQRERQRKNPHNGIRKKCSSVWESPNKRTDIRKIVNIQNATDVNSAVTCFTWPTLKYNREGDFYVQDVIGNDEELLAYYHKKMKAYFGFEHVLKRDTKKNNVLMSTHRTPVVQQTKIIVRKSHAPKVNDRKDDITNQQQTFDTLKPKTWILDWEMVDFHDGYFVVHSPDDRAYDFIPHRVECKKAMSSFNYIRKYIKAKVPTVFCTIFAKRLNITSPILIDEAILAFSKVARQRGIKVPTDRSPQRPLSQIPFCQALSKAQQLSPEGFKKYKSKFIDFLVSKQSKEHKIIPCVESLAHSNRETSEAAFLFTIQCLSGKMLVVHENVNPDRSTLMFVVFKDNFNKTIRTIYDFLQSAEINKRSSIREGSVKCDADVITYKSINHDNYSSWQKGIERYLKTAIRIPRKEADLMKTKFHSLSRLLREVQTKENFEKVRPFFEKCKLPLTRKVRPAEILALIPNSSCRIDSDGNKILPIREGCWSLEKLLALIEKK